jgi:hypothetical protein
MEQPLHAAKKSNPSLGGGPPPVLACTRFNNKTWQEYQQWMTAHQQSYEQIYQRPLKCIYGCPREISNKKIPPQAKILVIEMNNDENKIEGIGEIINQTASEVYKPAVGGRNPPFNQSNEVPVAGGRNPHQSNEVPAVGGRNPHQSNEVPVAGGRIPPANPPPFRKIFSDRNYTRYIYIGNTRYASREELERNHTEDAQYINNQLKALLPPTPSLGGGTPLERNNTPDAQYINKQLEGLLPQQQQQQQQQQPSATAITQIELLLFKGARHMKRGSGITRCQFK